MQPQSPIASSAHLTLPVGHVQLVIPIQVVLHVSRLVILAIVLHVLQLLGVLPVILAIEELQEILFVN